jgi:hypothetical protein
MCNVTRMTAHDWHAWHETYENPQSPLVRRLGMIQGQIRAMLDEAPPGPLRAISLCAGQGRDLIGVLASHPRGTDVTARLVELDPRNTESARRLAADAGLEDVEVITGDAALTSHYVPLVPAHLVVACGLFGNMTDADVKRTIGFCPQLCAVGGTVVWTRGRWAPDLLPQVCEWFEDLGFERIWVSPPDFRPGCGAHRFAGTPVRLEEGTSMFTFRGHHPVTGPPRA